MKTLYFDCFAGVSGDMVLGALTDLVGEPDFLPRELARLQLPFSLEVNRGQKLGVTGTKVTVRDCAGRPMDEEPEEPGAHGAHHGHEAQGHRGGGAEAEHHHHPGAAEHPHHHEHGDAAHHHGHGEHGHHEHEHRTLAGVCHLIDHADLPPEVGESAKAIFGRIAAAEAKVHGATVEAVHFHEVGAVDAIVDVVGACLLMARIAPDRVVASPVHVGSGVVRCAHGLMPVPAPATAEILQGIPTYARPGIDKEMTTPTGAAILAHFCTEYGVQPAMAVESTGYGLGQRDVPELPNCLRVLLGDEERPRESVAVLETHIDDMQPEAYSYLMERLFEAGALDVAYAPIYMKKNRPGVAVTVIATPEGEGAALEVLLAETSTLGVRRQLVERVTLPRRLLTVTLPGGEVRVKVAGRQKYAPEYEDVRRYARETGASFAQTYQLAQETARKTDFNPEKE